MELFTRKWRMITGIALFTLFLTAAPTSALAGEILPPDKAPAITIIIDDMGNQEVFGEQALSLPGKITYSFLPHTPHARRQAITAHTLGKEVMLHLPM